MRTLTLFKLQASKNALLLLVLILSLSLKAQWIKLPAPQLNEPYSTYNYSLSRIQPVDDGKIVYISSCYFSPTSGSNSNIYESVDDLNFNKIKRSVSGQGASFDGFAHYKDSNFVFISSWMGYGTLYHTNNDFINNNPISYCGYGWYINTPIKSYTLTSSYIYLTTQHLFTDTFRVVRVSNSNLTQPICIEFPNYNLLNNKLYFLNDSIGFILCRYKNNNAKQVLLKTINYGTSWSEIMLDSTLGIKDFHFPSINTGYILKNNGAIFKTSDGGSTWNNINSNITVPLNCIKFSDDSIGYVAGMSGHLSKTADGGNSWNLEQSNTTSTITSLYTFSNNVVYFKDSTNSLFKNTPLKLLPVSPLNVTISTNTSQTTTCPGTSINLIASGASSYTWSSNAGAVNFHVVTVSPQTNTTYTVIGTNTTGVYTDTQTVAITVFPVPQIISTPLIAEICQNSGDSITFTGSNAISYVWSTDLGFVYEPTLTVNSNISQTYTLGGSDTNGCYDTVLVQLNIINCPELLVYPNPSSTTLMIKSLSSPIIELRIDNSLGQNCYTSLLDKKHIINFDVSNFNEGLYFITITTESSKIKRKILIKH